MPMKKTKEVPPGAVKSVSRALPPVSIDELKNIIKDLVTEIINPLTQQIKCLEAGMDSFQTETTVVKKMAKRTEETAWKEIARMNEEQFVLENQLIALQMEKAQLSLRIQNVVEEEGEDVNEMISTLLAPRTGKSKEYFKSESQEAYWFSSAYIKKNNLP